MENNISVNLIIKRICELRLSASRLNESMHQEQLRLINEKLDLIESCILGAKNEKEDKIEYIKAKLLELSTLNKEKEVSRDDYKKLIANVGLFNKLTNIDYNNINMFLQNNEIKLVDSYSSGITSLLEGRVGEDKNNEVDPVIEALKENAKISSRRPKIDFNGMRYED